ncbi:right-handed parallel beta-helix repeat-containing protein [Actinospica sp. MGRD01-02]|uniref:Right-handed parallel beta-helix repeat-containing protein n=1 Tax=Actinospica acidithermotolerans TaxID=2828514 RepID=A0A941EHN8_9ACTN|nr:pectinesterase family protein [Actinospica acidithermotolerans]MBR7830978.1 right-handed parallel beta-helix repeat-containing protein [Actinospica acidithermotolerans]
MSGSTHRDFLSGPLTVHAKETLVVGEGVTLFASRKASAYQNSASSASCGTLSSKEGGCNAFITVSGANAGIMGERGSSGQGSIDGRGDESMLGTSTSWWTLAKEAQTAGDNQQSPRLIQVNSSNSFTAYDINLLNSPMFHLYYSNGTGLTVWGVRIETPATARNTDGIDIAGTTDATVYDSYIEDGDDGIAIKAGSAATSNVTISDSHFYGTHGISIGSETNSGVSNVLVENNTVDGEDSAGNVSGSDNGLRIKSDASRGGSVHNVEYLNNCLTHMKAPLVFDTRYSSSSGSDIPNFTAITVEGVVSVNSLSGAKNDLVGYSSTYPLGLYLSHVKLDATGSTAEYAKVYQYDSNLTASGTGVSVSALSSAAGSYPTCSFPSVPSVTAATASAASTTATTSATTSATAKAAAAAAASADTLTVGPSGSGASYTSVQAAVNAVPANSSSTYTIKIAAGTYHEQVTVPADKPNVEFLGATGNPANVVISDDIASGTAKSGGGTYGTEGSATVTVDAANFTAKYVTFKNSFSPVKHPSITAKQAVALNADGDRQTYVDDVFYGHQDTLLGWGSSSNTTLRNYFYDSTIEGDVDFIFGDNAMVFDHSTIDILDDGFSNEGAITAAATYSANSYGILVTNSTVTTSNTTTSWWLGRPWEPASGMVPQVVFRNTSLPSAINPSTPWTDMGSATWQSARFDQYDDSGAAASAGPQLSSSTAASYTAQKYLAGTDGWDPVL